MFFFKFEFHSHDQMRKFALAIHDKPFPIFLGKILGEDALVSQIYLPKWEFRMFVKALSSLIRDGPLKGYHYIIQDIVPELEADDPIPTLQGRWMGLRRGETLQGDR